MTSAPLIVHSRLYDDVLSKNLVSFSEDIDYTSFMNMSDTEVKQFILSYDTSIPQEKLDVLVSHPRKELYQACVDNRLEDLMTIHDIKNSINAAVKHANTFIPEAHVPLSSLNGIASGSDWDNKNKPVEIDVKFEDSYIVYTFKDINDSRGYILALLFAVPEIFVQFVKDFPYRDDEVFFADAAYVKESVTDAISSLSDIAVTNEQFLIKLAKASFISFGKIISNLHKEYDSFGFVTSDTRTSLVFILYMCNVGIQVNNTVWGNKEKIIDGVNIEFTDSEIIVTNNRYTILSSSNFTYVQNALPSNVLVEYQEHLRWRKNADIFSKIEKDYWKTLIYTNVNFQTSVKQLFYSIQRINYKKR